MPTATIEIDFIWVPSNLGGHRAAPYAGMRLELRWQRHVKEWLDRAWDVECSTVTFDEVTARWAGTLTFSSPDPLPHGWLQVGEPIEMLNGHRVLGVGRIVRIHE